MACHAHIFQRIKAGMLDKLMPDCGGWRLVAGTDAGGRDESDVLTGIGPQCLKQALPPGHHAGQGGADPHGTGGRGSFTLAHQIEMIVKAGNFPDFGHRQPHQMRQCGKVPGREMLVRILNDMQIFDQHIALRCDLATRAFNKQPAKQASHLG